MPPSVDPRGEQHSSVAAVPGYVWIGCCRAWEAFDSLDRIEERQYMLDSVSKFFGPGDLLICWGVLCGDNRLAEGMSAIVWAFALYRMKRDECVSKERYNAQWRYIHRNNLAYESFVAWNEEILRCHTLVLAELDGIQTWRSIFGAR